MIQIEVAADAFKSLAMTGNAVLAIAVSSEAKDAPRRMPMSARSWLALKAWSEEEMAIRSRLD
jgi:hypothetical protein